MKITYSWLKDFVDIRMKPQSLAGKLTMAGLSVASLSRSGDDWVYDIEVTSNRPDCLSVEGIAREVAAVTKSKLKKIVTTSPRHQVTRSQEKTEGRRTRDEGRFCVDIDDKKGCSFYGAALFSGVRVGPSPPWLKRRLEAVGVRAVNNVVDITNYCLVELGQPLHAFDLDKLSGRRILVRRARPGEVLRLIDGSEKKLDHGILVIADGAKPVAVAGVMGGEESAVSAKTTRILLESACFDPVLVRATSRALRVATDSSYRFERGVDIPTVRRALERAAEMILGLAGGRAGSVFFEGQPAGTVQHRIKTVVDFAAIKRLLGVEIGEQEGRNILSRLGFSASAKKKGMLEVVVPCHRRDVSSEADVAEEIARIYGYDRIPSTAPHLAPFSLPPSRRLRAAEKIKSQLVSFGLKEVVTSGLIGDEDYEKSGLEVPAGALVLENPLSQENRIVRTTLLPSLLGRIAFNVNRGLRDAEIFEISSVSDATGDSCALGIALCGAKRSGWVNDARPYTFFDMKGLIEGVLAELTVGGCELRPRGQQGFFEKHQACDIVVRGEAIGYFGSISEATKKAHGLKGREEVFAAEVLVDPLAEAACFEKIFRPYPLTPSVLRDISMLAGERASYGAMRRLIEEEAAGYLRGIFLVERYEGQGVPEGSVALCVSVAYGASDRTLSDEEVNALHKKVLERLTREYSVTLR